METPIKAYELEDCGADHSQYFPGRGVSFTKWDLCYVGAGNSPREAIEDALEQAATCGYDVSAVKGLSRFSKHRPRSMPRDNDEWYCYAAIYIKI